MKRDRTLYILNRLILLYYSPQTQMTNEQLKQYIFDSYLSTGELIDMFWIWEKVYWAITDAIYELSPKWVKSVFKDIQNREEENAIKRDI